ncbi:hypothetical protein AB0H76_17605 [Nocardia sp. NPDC050712]|uniref:hypothetical protein n=1 Tax=Nocardia sp. NPDC050712 TaxID=3155518 RepID=UPI0034019CB0
MPEKFGGQIFYSDDEAKKLGLIPSSEEIANAERMFEQFGAARSAAGPAPEGTTPGFGGKFSDDHEGTEFEGWTYQAGQWYDQDGQLVRYNEDGTRA